MVTLDRRPGRKPHRLYLRVVSALEAKQFAPPAPKEIREFLASLDRTGRLIAHGALTHPVGDLLFLRATDLDEARRAVRRDPFAGIARTSYLLWEWDPQETGSGVNLEPPPARGSGRLVLLERFTVFVRDRAKAKEWYETDLGLQARADDPSSGHLEMALGPETAGLAISVPDPSWGEAAFAEALARVGRATGLVFRTDSVRALALRLEHAQARITQPPRAEPWGEWTIRFTDPDGNEYLAYGPEGAPSKEPAAPPARRPAIVARRPLRSRASAGRIGPARNR